MEALKEREKQLGREVAELRKRVRDLEIERDCLLDQVVSAHRREQASRDRQAA